MPWRRSRTPGTSAARPDNDFDSGVTSVHQKWWAEPESGSQQLKDFFMKKKQQMEDFYRTQDGGDRQNEAYRKPRFHDLGDA